MNRLRKAISIFLIVTLFSVTLILAGCGKKTIKTKPTEKKPKTGSGVFHDAFIYGNNNYYGSWYYTTTGDQQTRYDTKLEEDTYVTLVATPNAERGGTFDGWYLNEKLISTETTYEYLVDDKENIHLEARFNTTNPEYVHLFVKNSNLNAGSVSTYDNEMVLKGSRVVLSATPNDGLFFDCWRTENSASPISTSRETHYYVVTDVKITAYWQLISLNLINNNKNAGTLDGTGSFNYYQMAYIKATPNPGYTFKGWYDADGKLFSQFAEFGFVLTKPTTLYAEWTSSGVLPTYTFSTINEDSSCGTITDYTNEEFKQGDTISLVATPKAGYVFDGWYNGTQKVSGSASYSFTITTDLVLTAKWTSAASTTYKLTTVNDDSTAGSITSYTNEVFEANAEVTLTATANSGYVFDGWYNGSNRISASTSYTFAITSNLTLTAKWTVIPVDKYLLTTINSYTAAGTATNYTNVEFEKNESVTLLVTANSGYIFDGWYNGTTKVSGSTSYTFTITSNLTLTAKWLIKISTTTNETTAGTYTQYNNQPFAPNATVTLTATTSTSGGYTFDGWYNGSTLLSSNASYDHKVTAPITITAKWVYYTLTVMPCYNSDNYIPETEEYMKIAGTVSTMEATKITAGQKVYLIADPKMHSVTWLGWYEKSGSTFTLLSTAKNYEYTMPKANTYIVAKFLLYKFVEGYDNKVVEYGYYPQSLVEDSDTLNELAPYVGSLPEVDGSTVTLNGWTDYNYYNSGNIESYMYYKDVDLDNDTINDYRAVYFTKYRGTSLTSQASAAGSKVDDNGYETETVYWFSYDPIIWDIVDDYTTGTKVLVSRYILDAQNWHDSTADRANGLETIYANNYKESTIRTWLNTTFNNTAFDTTRIYRCNLINLTDNSLASTTKTSNDYICEDTSDKVYLLSTKEFNDYLKDATVGSTNLKQTRGTDYAKIQGIDVSTSSSSVGYSPYWLRSPYSGSKTGAIDVSATGSAGTWQGVKTVYGIRPAVNLIL